MQLVLDTNGNARTIYSPDALQIIEALGEPVIRRASRVEPYNELSQPAKALLAELGHVDSRAWFADMTPVGGPVLGPFNAQPDALAAENQWLLDNNIPPVLTPPV